jgi:excinuclease UvrABC nuclease subunit
MLSAANNLEFEKAALLRDQVRELKRTLNGGPPATAGAPRRATSYRKTKATRSR